MKLSKLIGVILFPIFSINSVFCEEKTFPGAIAIIPAIIPAIQVAGQVLPVIISAIQGIPTRPPSALPIAISHTTSISTNLLNKPIAASHSGSISTSNSVHASSHGHAASWSQATGNGVHSSSSSSTADRIAKNIFRLSPNSLRKIIYGRGKIV